MCYIAKIKKMVRVLAWKWRKTAELDENVHGPGVGRREDKDFCGFLCLKL